MHNEDLHPHHGHQHPEPPRLPAGDASLFLLLEWFRSHLERAPTKDDLKQTEKKIMSIISEYVTKVNDQLSAIESDIGKITDSQTGIAGDVKFLKETIEKMNSNPGPITAEDQALLDAAISRLGSLTSKVAAQATALEAIDAGTPPAPPVQPPV